MICLPYRLPRQLLLCLCALSGLLLATSAWADTVVAAKRIVLSGVTLQDVQAQLAPGTDPDTVQINLHAGKADIPAFGLHHVALTLSGHLLRDRQMRWMFDGALQLAGAPGGALSNATINMLVDSSANTLEINADQGVTHIGTAFPLDQTSHVQINLRNLPAGWLQGLLATVWPGHINGGKLDADLALDVRDQGYQSSGDFNVADLAYSTPAGNPGGDALAGHMRFAVDANGHPAQLTLNGGLHGGMLQLGPVSARLPTHDVVFDLTAGMDKGGLVINQLHLDDADSLQLSGALAIDAKGNLQKLRLDHFQARFPVAYDRYGQSWLSGAGHSLDLAGQLEGHVDYEGDSWRSFAFHTDWLDAADGTGLVQAHGLRGDVDWAAQGDRAVTNVAWNQLALRQFTLGATQSHWRSRSGTLSLQSPLELPLWKGQVHVTGLEWRPAAAKAERVNLVANVSNVDMATLNQSQGWLPFAGTLGGSISALTWEDGRYAMRGELTVKAFGGSAVINHLSVQQPFGASPVLEGDIALHQLDLAPLADTFNFGSMSGRLDGSIDGLQLVNSTPVAFKASLQAENGGRISLHAANNLSVLTGGAPASGLQGAVMKLFKTLGYKRMGIDASLQDGICTLSGLGSNANQSEYTIVEGSGLPYLHVVGEQSRVEWPVLMHRLKTATQGTVADR
ncbi:DUF748 domain-containing protein [Dyella acidiphila]|uniref:DUF748 domain-containing protein n=1 Tax=Dyella acidiphila TaxID=2775866 RepID=A0ABR9GAT6_9GAMM|nr:DUF748 domain-containing protein [Dyella acidiphila]MBE1161160.1 DUF748 domain-containing protein [Dyella acidiphila]